MRITPASILSLLVATTAAAAPADPLRDRIARLEAELAAARAELAERDRVDRGDPRPEPLPVTDEAAVPAPVDEDPDGDDGLRFGNLKIGGAMRVNWTLGDYDTGTRGPSRGGHGGDFSLDTFRINLDYASGNRFGKAEYRWYPGTNFFHTLEFGIQHGDTPAWRAGLTRVPFGVGPYGPSNNWFFDQHYYVGLADDMDLGVVRTIERGPWTLDFGVFASSPPNMRGSSDAGARYSFDIVNASADPNYFGNLAPTSYVESGQINLRAIRKFAGIRAPTDLGLSLQYGRLDGKDGTADVTPRAISLHSLTTYENWELKLQATHYDYDSHLDHISGGFYDYTTDIAARGTLLSAALSYKWEDPVPWLDSIMLYNDFSVIRKHASGYRSSALNVLGASFAKDGWFIYCDWALSNGNEFVGDFRPGTLAGNEGQRWQSRFNINFGYYF